MTSRRTILQGAASLMAPAEIELGKRLDLPMAGSPFGILINEYRQILQYLDGLYDAQNRAEEAAVARKAHRQDSPAIQAIIEKQAEYYRAEKKLIQLASRTRAASIDDVMLKLLLWRLTDFEAECFNNAGDMLSFSAYRDLLALTGQAPLTPVADEKAQAIIWDDRAFHYEDEEEEGDDYE